MTPVTGFPLLLDVAGRRVVVVGGGAVGTRRAAALREAGADVVVVAPRIASRAGARSTSPSSAAGSPPATSTGPGWPWPAPTSPTVNAAVAAAAEQRRVFCVRADAAADGSARTPAVLRRDGLTVAVSGGDDPRRAVALRDAISVALDLGELPARPVRPPDPGGSVALVGGGPGDPELITVRGRRLVAAADVVVVDRLAPRDLLDDLPDAVEVIDCGKSPHRHNLTQAEINARARRPGAGRQAGGAAQGRRPVRLRPRGRGVPGLRGRRGRRSRWCRASVRRWPARPRPASR